MEFRMIDHCRIEFDDGAKTIEHGLIRGNGEAIQIARYETETITLSDGRDVQEETGRTAAVETIDQAVVSEGKRGQFAITGFARSKRNTPAEEEPFTIRVIPDTRLCTTCG